MLVYWNCSGGYYEDGISVVSLYKVIGKSVMMERIYWLY